MIRMGTNSDLPQKRRFPASSFEFRLFLMASSFRFAHPPLAYMRARACIRVSGSRKYAYTRHPHPTGCGRVIARSIGSFSER
jgi:hypothetical protein